MKVSDDEDRRGSRKSSSHMGPSNSHLGLAELDHFFNRTDSPQPILNRAGIHVLDNTNNEVHQTQDLVPEVSPNEVTIPFQFPGVTVQSGCQKHQRISNLTSATSAICIR